MSPPWANIFHLDSKGLEVACGAAVVWQVRDLLVHRDQQPNLVCLLRPFGGESAVCVRVCESPIALCLYFRISHIPFLSLSNSVRFHVFEVFAGFCIGSLYDEVEVKWEQL